MKVKSLVGIVITLSSFMLILSCSDREGKNSEKDVETETPEELQKKVELDTIRLVSLSEKADDATEDWMMYIALNSEVERFKDYTLLDVVNNAGTVNNVVDSLAKTVPKIFDTNAIRARIITLRTHSELLRDNSSRNEPNPSEIEELTAKLKFDFNNLNIQLNEVFIIQENSEDPIEN